MKKPNALPRAKKAFGQHFLTDHAAVTELIDMMAIPADATVVEVGPGPGILTRALAAHCAKLHAVELDKEMISYLTHTLSLPCALPNLSITGADILKTDLSALTGITPPQQIYVASNLPYQISSPFLFHMIAQLPIIAGIGLMLQKEVVERMIAVNDSSDYGRLSVMIQYYFELTRGSDVPPSAFTPPPAVDSALVALKPKPLDNAKLALAPHLSTVVKQAFAQRRKTLRNTLKPLFTGDELQALGIDPSMRAQTLALADFIRMAEHMQTRQQKAQPES